MGEDVEKSLYLSYTEILKGLHFIKDAIDFVEQGKDYYVIPLSGQLRAIFVLPFPFLSCGKTNIARN